MMTEKITSRKNPLLQHIRKLLSNRAYREQCGEYAADGVKLLDEAIRWIPDQLRTVLITQKVQPQALPDHVRVVEIPEDVMEQLSPMQTPQGALFTCALPRQETIRWPQRCLILDGIQDPGNLGTILRTADALEIPVFLTPGCADAYSHKTVRASMGAVFRTAPCRLTQEQIADCCTEHRMPLYVTALTQRADDLRKIRLDHAAVVIGSEGRGVGEFFMKRADSELIIPMNSRCESLNAAVAATIVMWQMKQ